MRRIAERFRAGCDRSIGRQKIIRDGEIDRDDAVGVDLELRACVRFRFVVLRETISLISSNVGNA